MPGEKASVFVAEVLAFDTLALFIFNGSVQSACSQVVMLAVCHRNIGTRAIVDFSLSWLLVNCLLAHCLALQCRGRDEMANSAARTVAKPRWLAHLTLAMDTGRLGDVVSPHVVIRCCPVLLQNLWRTAERSRVVFCHYFAAGSPNHMEVCVLLLARRR